MDGEWLCLRELADMTTSSPTTPKLQSPAEEDEGISFSKIISANKTKSLQNIYTRASPKHTNILAKMLGPCDK